MILALAAIGAAAIVFLVSLGTILVIVDRFAHGPDALGLIPFCVIAAGVLAVAAGAATFVLGIR
jgi:hypothetical protein